MRLQTLVLLFSLAFVSPTLVSCGSSSPPMPMPTLAMTLPATAMPTVATTVAESATPTQTASISLAPFMITLPTPWAVVRSSDADWRSRIAQHQAKNNQFGRYLTDLAAMPVLTDTVAIAWSVTGDVDLALTAVLLPADGLTLQTFLEAAKAQLEQSRLAIGSGLTIEQAAIRYDLHEAQLPIAAIQYSMPVANVDATTAVATLDYQAAMLDQSGTHLLLLSFVAQQADPVPALTLIETIVAGLQDTTVDQEARSAAQ